MSQINVLRLSFSYEGSYDTIFENVSFQIDTDWKLGFIGRNGRGKTTFLKLLMGEYQYSGNISAGVEFEYFPYEVKEPEQDTLRVLEGIAPDCQLWQIERELSLLDVAEDVLYRSFGTLSNGEQTKALLAALFLKENSFLLIDEPTNHLDLASRRKVGDYLRGKQGFILVSHDRCFLDSCIDHVLSINKADIEIQKGNFSSWWRNRQLRDRFELAENEKLKKDINRLAQATERSTRWSDQVEKSKFGTKVSGVKPDKGHIGAQAARMMKRAKATESRQRAAMEEKAGLLKNIEHSAELKVSQLPYHGNRLVTLEGVSIFYESRPACRDVSFSIERGDRVALQGKNGSGKTSLLKLILGESLSYTGNLQQGSGLAISYVPQEIGFLQGSLREFSVARGIEESLFKAILIKLGFSRQQFEKDMRQLSKGQKKKVLIAGSLCERAHLHIWDEPLNFIDVISRMQIEELLLAHRPTILFVEHDDAFCENVATKRIFLD